MKQLSLVVAACLAFPGLAWSLSCIRPDIVRTYEEARDSEAGFWIVRGRIIAEGPIAVPQPDAKGRHENDARASTPVRFVGQGVRTNGEYTGFARDITLTVTCIAHWCGSPPLDDEVFAAIEVKSSGPELLVDACSTRVILYSEDGEKRLSDCVRNNMCEIR